MTQDQITAYIRTLCTILGTLSTAGLPFTQAQIGVIGSGLQGIAALGFLAYSFYGTWKANTAKGVVVKAANVPGTTVVTTPEIARATPDNDNIVSAESHKVATKF